MSIVPIDGSSSGSSSRAPKADDGAAVAPSAAGLAPVDPDLLASLPLRLRAVSGRTPGTREALPARGGCADDPQLSAASQRVWDAERAAARALVSQYRALAALHELEGEYEECEEVNEVDTLRAALALRVTRGAAGWRLRDAHQAVHLLPRALARLDSGEISAAWFERILKGSRSLSDDSRRQLDEILSTWFADITSERFFTLLKGLIELLRQREDRPDPESCLERSVELLPSPQPGVGILQITGPIPDILACFTELDETARALQAAQRAALREGAPIPHDPEGTVLESGRALSLTRLRFALLTSAQLDPDGVDVPAPRFRLNITIPALTLLGASDEPGMLEGTTPLPPSMARSLAGSADVWYRVLTDPCSGAFLPLPAERYTPTPAMLEHLRLRSAQCAVPGCTRPSSWASECDHLEECRRGTPGAGGPTDLENLHLLCWQHHLDKTTGLLDPVRIPTGPTEPGRTRWRIGGAGDAVTVIDDLDVASLRMVEGLTAAWSSFLRGTYAGEPAPNPGGGEDETPPDWDIAELLDPRPSADASPCPPLEPPPYPPLEPPLGGWGDAGPPPF
ncbi:HNH endonuclease signature motif containing protein [Brachybacterium sp. J153]|uniref:HNH endonuclease signature motif containing protein n=1 Tax=Brachybacterium sp. J153 TaxID=3116488 RepID=UPI002E785DE4|nr:DUF222 domain-containing protein [Brachybacterium sp. J153]MEE1617896.1 DUF222 domain-containing protein [Brachybacterium sp. J153]